MSNIIKITLCITIIINAFILNGFSSNQATSTTIENTSKEENPPKLLPIKKDDIIKISSGFGKTTNSNHKTEQTHKGIDFIAAKGTSILATGDGEVIFSGFSKIYGYHIIIKHSDIYKSLYAHMISLNVDKGQKVNATDIIGIIGSTGKASGIHLHYEVIENGSKINPNPLFNTD